MNNKIYDKENIIFMRLLVVHQLYYMKLDIEFASFPLVFEVT